MPPTGEVCPTIRGRSDIFVGFIETGLRLLKPEGALGFIVADRWMHNQYGSDLRKFIAGGYSVETVLTMHDVDAFEERVSAYPAIAVIRRAEQSTAVVGERHGEFGEDTVPVFSKWVGSSQQVEDDESAVTAVKLPTWFDSNTSWPSGNPANLALLADLESRFPPLEDPSTGTRVGIGVATGADSVYLTDDPDLVEPDRLLPMLMTRDTDDRRCELVRHLPRESVGRRQARQPRRVPTDEAVPRVVERRSPQQARRAEEPVALVPNHRPSRTGICGTGTSWSSPTSRPSFSPCSIGARRIRTTACTSSPPTSWDLEVLGGLLLSDIAELFVSMYCVKMRGGCYRFQAQYLRRIRVPLSEGLHRRDERQLVAAFEARDRQKASAVARRVYDLDPDLSLAAS